MWALWFESRDEWVRLGKQQVDFSADYASYIRSTPRKIRPKRDPRPRRKVIKIDDQAGNDDGQVMEVDGVGA